MCFVFLFRLVENTINIAVKELLFGPGMVTSSCESDRPDDLVNISVYMHVSYSKSPIFYVKTVFLICYQTLVPAPCF